jgi:hypothetical protein
MRRKPVKKVVVASELDKIARKDQGILRPIAVVKEAEPKTHPLHPCFEWDNRRAGHAYRLWQARELIKSVTVTVEANGRDVSVKAWLSLDDERTGAGGYRYTIDVLSDGDQRERALRFALADLQRWEQKYHTLRELSPIFAAASKVRRKRRRKARA